MIPKETLEKWHKDALMALRLIKTMQGDSNEIIKRRGIQNSILLMTQELLNQQLTDERGYTK